MEFEYERLVEAPADAVWAALNDVSVMESHLPGNAHVASTGPEKFRVSMKISMGFLRPTVNVDVGLSNVSPNDSFRFEFQGKAMGAGVEGAANVSLDSSGDPDGGPKGFTQVKMSGSVHPSGLLQKVSDSKIEAAVAGFLDGYFASVERAGSQA